MTLQDIIRDRGAAECAKRWGVSVRAVNSWLYGERTPRPRKALEIVGIEGTKLSMAHIYEPQPSCEKPGIKECA